MSELFRDATGSTDGQGWRPIDKPSLELRIVSAREHLFSTSTTPQMAFWMRLKAPLAEAPMLHCAALAYLSDYWINTAAITYHMPARDAHSTLYIASLNHSIWFHRPSRRTTGCCFPAKVRVPSKDVRLRSRASTTGTARWWCRSHRSA
jgi:acyl-CoA thioesterase-2